MCAVAPVRKGTVITSCGISSRIIWILLITGTYPCHERMNVPMVHPKKKTKKGEKELNTKENKMNENETIYLIKGQHALKAQAESPGDKVAYCWYDQRYDEPVDGPREGRYQKTRRGTRQEEGRDRANKQNHQSYVKLVVPKGNTMQHQLGNTQYFGYVEL